MSVNWFSWLSYRFVVTISSLSWDASWRGSKELESSYELHVFSFFDWDIFFLTLCFVPEFYHKLFMESSVIIFGFKSVWYEDKIGVKNPWICLVISTAVLKIDLFYLLLGTKNFADFCLLFNLLLLANCWKQWALRSVIYFLLKWFVWFLTYFLIFCFVILKKIFHWCSNPDRELQLRL